MPENITAQFTTAYNPYNAENGKFVCLDTESLGLSSSYGRFAVLTYQTNPSNLILSGGSVLVNNVCAIITDNYTEANTIWVGASTYGVAQLNVYNNFTQEFTIFNGTVGTVYCLPSATNYNNLLVYGMPVLPNEKFSMKINTNDISIASISGGDVRIIGSYSNRI